VQKSSLDILRHQKGFDVKAPKDCKEKLKLRLSSSQVTMDTGEHVSWSGTRLGGKVQGRWWRGTNEECSLWRCGLGCRKPA